MRVTNMFRRREERLHAAAPFSVKPLVAADKKSKLARSNQICFACRKRGHSANTCREATDSHVTQCFHCGSFDHQISECTSADKTFKFATCFVCKQTGHLASACPRNTKGMYPNGGCCRYCQSVEHLARDCPSKQIKKDDGSIALGKLDLEQGGDDDDVFLAMYNKQQHHPVRKEPKAKRKVVHF